MKKVIITVASDPSLKKISRHSWSDEKTIELCMTDKIRTSISKEAQKVYEQLLTQRCLQLSSEFDSFIDELLTAGIAYEYTDNSQVDDSANPMNCSVFSLGMKRKPDHRLLVRNYSNLQLRYLAKVYLSQQGEYFGEGSTTDFWTEGEFNEQARIYRYIPKHQWLEFKEIVN